MNDHFAVHLKCCKSTILNFLKNQTIKTSKMKKNFSICKTIDYMDGKQSSSCLRLGEGEGLTTKGYTWAPNTVG